MKCQILFSGANNKDISKCHLLKILSRVLSINTVLDNIYALHDEFQDVTTTFTE